MINRLVVCVMFSLLTAPAAHSADSKGNYAIWGAGRQSCNQFLKAADKPELERFKNYLMGYLTAFNTLSEDTYNITAGENLSSAVTWLKGYCDLHQIESYDRAIQQFVDEKYEARFREPPGRKQGWGQGNPTQ